jgi:hypothetical protein
MEALRGKKILFASRSFGLNTFTGLTLLAKEDAKYDLLSSYVRYDVAKAGGDLSIIPADAFAQKHFVHFLATYWPHTKRVEEVDTLLRQPPHNFGKTVDFVIIYFHTAIPTNFEQYSTKMDALRRDFPNAKFVYVTAGFQGPGKAKENENAHAWSELVRARYKGKVPLFDMGAILSDDMKAGHQFAEGYSTDPADVHPNTPLGCKALAKGFLLVLVESMKWQGGDAKDAPAAGSAGAAAAAKPTTAPSDAPAETLAPTSPDYKAVRAILDANNLKQKTVDGACVVENGRVVKLYIQECGVTTITEQIGTLTELRVLHCYADRNLGHPFLTKVSPAIARCTKLEELLLTDNDLTALPPEIVKLTNLKSLSVAGNRLNRLPPAVAAWAKKFDPNGADKQRK